MIGMNDKKDIFSISFSQLEKKGLRKTAKEDDRLENACIVDDGGVRPVTKDNPFKRKGFSVELSLSDVHPLFKGEITQEVADMCNYLLPPNSISCCLPFTLLDKFFNDRLIISTYLAHYTCDPITEFQRIFVNYFLSKDV